MLDRKQLQVPKGVDENGPVEDTYLNYVKAVISIPEMLDRLIMSIDSLADSVDIIALYAERKGKDENLISDEDIPDGNDADNESN